MEFPERVFTEEEVQRARKAIEMGYKHPIVIVEGSPDFKRRVEEALELIKVADYYDFLRTYIGRIVEINGLSQLRTEEAAIWANRYAVADPVDAASFFIQKAYQMMEFIEGKPHFSGQGEMRAIKKRIEFLRALRERSGDESVRRRCQELIEFWTEPLFP